MTINPCCIPLKTGVRMVTHLSMALALAVGWTALKLISISSEVSSNVSTATSTGVTKPSDSRGGGIGSSNNVFIEQQPPQSFYNAHIFESHQVPPQYRIPYEYILYHKWHQQQQMLQQQQLAAGVDGYHHNLESQQHHQQQRPYYDDIYSSWYQQQQQQRQLQQHHYPSRVDRAEGNGFDAFSPTVPIPPPPEHQQEQQQSHLPQQEKKEESEDDEDEHSKIFRSVLHQRKNFKGVGPASTSSSSSLPSGELTSKLVKWRNSSTEEATTPENDGARVATAVMPQLQLTSSSKLVPPKEGDEEQTRERGQVSKDRSSSSPSLLFPLQNEKGSSSGFTFQPAVAAAPAATVPPQPPPSSRTHLTSSTALRRRQQQQRHNPSSEQQHDEEDNAHEMNRPRAMMMMMSKLARENPQDGVGYYGGISGRTSSSSKKLFPDFKEQYAKTLLISGLLALCTVVFQFLTSFLLLCFVDKGSNAAAQIWTAVHCSVIFCLATCLVLFLCEGLSMPKYIFDETLYLSLVTIDSILSIYFLWVVMAFI